MYVLERSVLDLLRARRTGLDRARRLPAAWSVTGSTGTWAPGYWKDIGTPERYLEATFDIFEGAVADRGRRAYGHDYVCVEDGVDNRGRIVPAALVERGCQIAAGARIGGRAVLEHGVTWARARRSRARS